MKNKLPKHRKGEVTSPLQKCKLCGCTDPLGPLPEHLTNVEMRTIISRFDIIQKEISNDTSTSQSAIAKVLSGSKDCKPTIAKLEKYFFSILSSPREIIMNNKNENIKNTISRGKSTQPDSSTQFKSPDKLSAPK